MVFFSENNLDPMLAMKVFRHYGGSALNLVRANPYLLSGEPFLFDFTAVDFMAQNLGFEKSDDMRIEAGLIYELYFNQFEGHVFIPCGTLIKITAQMLGLAEDRVEPVLLKMLGAGSIINEKVEDRDCCYLKGMHRAEVFCAQRLAFLTSRGFEIREDFSKAIAQIEAAHGIEYAGKQREAIEAALKTPVMVLTGGPGTGKTTTVRAILDMLDRIGSKTELCAPTGRAAKRLSELCGRDARTIHRMLGVVWSGDGMTYNHNEENPLDADAVVIDEMSMVDLPLFAALLAAVKNSCRLILVGDPDQLPSVGPGMVLRDILDSGTVAKIHLDEIFRQARESDIVVNAHKVNRGEMPALKGNRKDFFFMRRDTPDAVIKTVLELNGTRLPENMGFDLRDIQVITPSRVSATGVERLNPVLQEILNPRSPTKREKTFGAKTFREGDRVMQIKNNYDMQWKRGDGFEEGAGVFNGDIGVVTRIDAMEQKMTVEFDDKECDYPFDALDELDFAYALTVHKAQGSEFRAVILIAALKNSKLLNRKLFYTALTRARDMLVIVGNEECVETMVSNKKLYKRYSGLRWRLTELSGK